MIANNNLDSSSVQFRSVHHKFDHKQSPKQEEEPDQPPKLQIKSQNPQKHDHPELDNLTSKIDLIKLMVRIKFQRFGFKQDSLTQLIEEQIKALPNLQAVQNIHLHDTSTEVFLGVFSTIIGERTLLARLPSMQHSEEQENRPISQRQDQMNERRSRMQQEQPARRPRMGPSILCNICYNTSTSNVQQQCGHAFCLQCMKGYLRQNMRTDSYFIKCPEWDCNDLVSIKTIQDLLTKTEFKKFKYFRQKNQKELDPDNKFCSKPDCGQVLTNKNDRLVCPKCQSQFCQICLQRYHGEQKCNSILKNALEKTFQSLQIKKCPGCRSPIQKSDGCNHMTCKKCRFQFCWICQKKYTRHHYRYYNCFGCPGMMFEDQDEMISQRLKQICLYISVPFIFSIVVFCYLAALPVYMIGCFFLKPCIWSQQYAHYCQHRMAQCLCCQSDCCLKRLLIWFFLQPRALLYSIFIAPCKLTVMLCSSICEIFD